MDNEKNNFGSSCEILYKRRSVNQRWNQETVNVKS